MQTGNSLDGFRHSLGKPLHDQVLRNVLKFWFRSDVSEELACHDETLVVHLDVQWETTLLHKMLPLDGSIRDVHLDTSHDLDIDDASILDAIHDIGEASLLDAIHDVNLDDANLLDAILLIVLLLPIHLLMDDVTIIVHLVASLDVDVPLLLLPLRP